MRKIQFCSGLNKLEGWENYDLEIDISKTLPFEDSSISFILAEHVLEHIDIHKGFNFLKEIYRILEEDGTARICVPGIDSIYNKYNDNYKNFLIEKGLGDGSKLNAIESIIYNWGHKSVYTSELLSILCKSINFEISIKSSKKSDISELNNIEGHWKIIGDEINGIESIVIECTKPTINSYKIKLTDLIPHVITVEWFKDRQDKIKEMLNLLGFQDPVFHFSNRTSPYWKGLSSNHLEVIKSLEPPFLLLEDDCTLLANNWKDNIDIPEDAHVIYLGGTRNAEKYNGSMTNKKTSLAGFTKDKTVYESYSKEYVKVFNMHSTHALLFPNNCGRNIFVNAIEIYGRNCPIDVCYAKTMPFSTCLLLKKPFFYQQDGKNDNYTSRIFE